MLKAIPQRATLINIIKKSLLFFNSFLLNVFLIVFHQPAFEGYKFSGSGAKIAPGIPIKPTTAPII